MGLRELPSVLLGLPLCLAGAAGPTLLAQLEQLRSNQAGVMKAVRHREQCCDGTKAQRYRIGHFVPLSGDGSSSDGNVAMQQSHTHNSIRKEVRAANKHRADELAHLSLRIMTVPGAGSHRYLRHL